MKRFFTFLSILFAASSVVASAQGYLIKLKNSEPQSLKQFVSLHGGSLESVSPAGSLFLWKTSVEVITNHFRDNQVIFLEKNHPIKLFNNPSLERQKAKIAEFQKSISFTDGPAFPDNPDFQTPAIQATGSDPLLGNSWGLTQIGATQAWLSSPQGKEIVVAVTDSGVDYNHPDLIANMWRNKGEIPGDGIDNDNNGYIDDVVGYDFFSADNKPYDLTMSLSDILFKGGNPGHGTHVSGVVGARLNNALGTAGVAPQVKIMALRFIGEFGTGDSAGAIKAIDYAVANGAHIINASWGSEGEEEGDQALREALQRAEQKGVIFVAAAGNGRSNGMAALGFNNDTDSKPVFPASYPYKNIVAVAALDSKDSLAAFSNFGEKSVDLGAPGVKILSTVPGGKYQDTVLDLFGTKVTWDGTSMASPFVAGSLAVLLSQRPNMPMGDLIQTLLNHVDKVEALNGKVGSGGRLNIHSALEAVY